LGVFRLVQAIANIDFAPRKARKESGGTKMKHPAPNRNPLGAAARPHEHLLSFSPDPAQYDRFFRVISKAKKASAAMVLCASMLLAVQSFMVAAFGKEEAAKILRRFVDSGFKSSRPRRI
jgi:hypothetical protein